VRFIKLILSFTFLLLPLRITTANYFFRAEIFANQRHIRLLSAKSDLNSERAETHIPNLPKTQTWFILHRFFVKVKLLPAFLLKKSDNPDNADKNNNYSARNGDGVAQTARSFSRNDAEKNQKRGENYGDA
jgi:hypothetical protein